MTQHTCTVCGHVDAVATVRRPRTVAVSAFPDVIPTDGARALHADHVARRDGIPVAVGLLAPRALKKCKRSKKADPADVAFRKAHADAARFLAECAAGGRVTRWYADDTDPNAVRVWFAGPGGVFAPMGEQRVNVDAIRDRADEIARGDAWIAFGPLRIAA